MHPRIGLNIGPRDFNVGTTPTGPWDHDHNHIKTREQLKAYDPPLAQLCHEVLGEDQWRFVSPRERAGKDHLKDFDPAKFTGSC